MNTFSDFSELHTTANSGSTGAASSSALRQDILTEAEVQQLLALLQANTAPQPVAKPTVEPVTWSSEAIASFEEFYGVENAVGGPQNWQELKAAVEALSDRVDQTNARLDQTNAAVKTILQRQATKEDLAKMATKEELQEELKKCRAIMGRSE